MRNMRLMVRASAAYVGVVICTLAMAQSPKPNVIIFLADDMGIGDTSAYLGKKLENASTPLGVTVRTANLERLAQMGTVFTDVHSPSTMCSTSRYALLTGRHAYRSYQKSGTVLNWASPPMIDANRQTIGDMMQRAGYTTSAIGKWHVGNVFAGVNGNPVTPAGGGQSQAFYDSIRWPTAGNPNVESLVLGPVQQGFDSYYGILTNNQLANGNLRGLFRNNTLQGIPSYDGGLPTVAGWEVDKVGEKLANEALNQIDAFAGVGGAPSTKPMFMYYAPIANHGDYAPPDTMTLQGTSYAVKNQGRRTDGQDVNLREDLVHENDIVIGALLDKLQNTTDPLTGQPMIDNTIFIFTSDNGSDTTAPIPNAGLRDKKRSIHEGGHRVPFVAAWPGQIPAGGVSDQVFSHSDLYATLASVTGTSLSNMEAEDSENIFPALAGQTTAQFHRPGYTINHDNTYANTMTFGAALAIRSGNMKLVLSNDLVNNAGESVANPGQSIPVGLFDLNADPHEDVNLLGNPAYTGLVEELRLAALRGRNQGYSRSTIQQSYGPLLATDGGADLANSVNGAVGYEFTVGSLPVLITRLGMWDDGTGDSVNQETNTLNQDGDTVGTPDGLAAAHALRLFDKTSGLQVASVQITNANSVVEGEFRYVNLPSSVALFAGREYALTMSTSANDGDLYHTAVPFSGTAPIATSLLSDFTPLQTSTDGNYPTQLPNGMTATGAAAQDLYDFRFFVGPTASLAGIPVSMADFDFDGDADGKDFLIWQRGLGMANPTRANGDADLDGVVGALDLQLWKAAFATSSALLAAAGAVPEPSAAAILIPAMVALRAAHRRGRKSRARKAGDA